MQRAHKGCGGFVLVFRTCGNFNLYSVVYFQNAKISPDTSCIFMFPFFVALWSTLVLLCVCWFGEKTVLSPTKKSSIVWWSTLHPSGRLSWFHAISRCFTLIARYYMLVSCCFTIVSRSFHAHFTLILLCFTTAPKPKLDHHVTCYFPPNHVYSHTTKVLFFLYLLYLVIYINQYTNSTWREGQLHK